MQTAAHLGVLRGLERDAGGAGILAGAITAVGSVRSGLALGNVADPGRGVNSQPCKRSGLAAQNDPSHCEPCTASAISPP